MAAARTEIPTGRQRRHFFAKGGTKGWLAGLMASMLVVFVALWAFSASHQAAVRVETLPAAASASAQN